MLGVRGLREPEGWDGFGFGCGGSGNATGPERDEECREE